MPAIIILGRDGQAKRGPRVLSEQCVPVVNVKVHLYERFDYPDYFVTPIYYNVCFPGHQLFTDAERISEGW